MNLGELEDGVSAEEQLLEALGGKNKEEENAEEVQAILVECRVTLDRADTKDNAKEADSCLPCKRRFKCADDGPHQVVPQDKMCALCRREERIWHQHT